MNNIIIAFFDIDGTLININKKAISEKMLQAVGLGVAMENASDELKEDADEVCGHVANDGIYHY